jgi:threonine dehydratase
MSVTVDRASIIAAQARIASDLRRTPLWRLPGAALGLACAEVWLKLEQLQVSGSFKARGMFNRLRAAAAERALPEAGVVIASGGNAGIAAACAARALGLACEVFVPELTSQAKRARLASLGARVVVGGAAYVDALEACLARQRHTGALLMHAYDQPEVVAGAGTLALEIEQDGGLPDRVLVSVGGGGLVAGIAAAFESRSRIEALEPALAPTLHAARAAGRPVDVAVAGTAADALGARRIGALAWPICERHVAAAHLLDDAAITEAQRRMWCELRLAVEPAAALPLAALWAASCGRPAANAWR